MRGVWISTHLSLDWPNRTQSPAQQRAALSTLLDHDKATGMNAVFLQVRSQSRVQGAISQDPSLNRPGYGIVDLGASLSESKGKYKLSVGIKNLFDKHYASGNVGSFLSFKTTSGPSISSNGWQPARDAFRYATIRLDVAF